MIINTKIVDITDIFNNTKSKFIKNSIESGKKLFAIKLDKFSGLLGYEIQPNRRIGSELADVSKRFGLKGILHSDELPGYGISEEEVNEIKKKLGCSEEDGFIILITEDYKKANLIFEKIIERLNEMIKKMPKDTRQVNQDGTTSFLRPQPGSARMYPETDHSLIFVEKEVKDFEKYTEIIYTIKYGDKNIIFSVIKLKEQDIELYFSLKDIGKFILDSLNPEFRKKILKHLGFNEKQIENILWSEYLEEIENLARITNPSIVYYIFFQLPSELKKYYNTLVEKIDIDFVKKIVECLNKGKIAKTAISKIYYYYIKEKEDVEKIIEKYSLFKISGKDLEQKIKELLEKYKEKDKNKLLNKILEELRYIAEPKEVIEIFNKLYK